MVLVYLMDCPHHGCDRAHPLLCGAAALTSVIRPELRQLRGPKVKVVVSTASRTPRATPPYENPLGDEAHYKGGISPASLDRGKLPWICSRHATLGRGPLGVLGGWIGEVSPIPYTHFMWLIDYIPCSWG
ncbi:hypothetical protein GCM10010298_50820 [Streptomyces microflavus]|uniref:Uncharacterized protein n=1 Tax=Streptomyces microflavus TaxID=1919 RepID=A0A7J0CKG0_STRMI|nr:hypothetical protein Smic_08010 [Streptomyces microflavus]GGX79293.1 hypothetical protein GCM10010298_50820 [Streptomyces microflavus]